MEENKNPLYQTGVTAPPKTYSGIIAVLLVLVIFLGGVVSILGLMNIHLFRKLTRQQEEGAAMAFETCAVQAETTDWSLAIYEEPQNIERSDDRPSLGVMGQQISPFYAEYYSVPQGVYITQVDPDSDAWLQGIREGDILLSFSGTRITGSDSLHAALSQKLPGDRVAVCVYRKGHHYDFNVVLTQLAADE